MSVFETSDAVNVGMTIQAEGRLRLQLAVWMFAGLQAQEADCEQLCEVCCEVRELISD